MEEYKLFPDAAQPYRYLEWLKDGMLRPRDQQDVNARLRAKELDSELRKIYLQSFLDGYKGKDYDYRRCMAVEKQWMKFVATKRDKLWPTRHGADRKRL